MDQIKYAVLETSGSISINPMESDVEEIMDFRIKALDQKLDTVPARLPNDRGAAS